MIQIDSGCIFSPLGHQYAMFFNIHDPDQVHMQIIKKRKVNKFYDRLILLGPRVSKFVTIL